MQVVVSSNLATPTIEGPDFSVLPEESGPSPFSDPALGNTGVTRGARTPERVRADETAEAAPVQRDRQAFAKNLKRLRLERGLTQVDVAALAGMTQGHYSMVENGNWEPRLGTILALAKALGVQPGELLPLIDLDGEVS